ncbi:MAG: 30S ribosomal protein S16 [Planctomycetaceae bacterium]|nr:30S ribosomal protein S16 [Planctomycetaceae bacterium]
MSVRIRMKMTGRKHQPFFRICIIDRQKARDGLPIEEVGTYDPMVKVKSERVKLNMERIDYWMSVGALPSERVATLIKKVKLNRFGTAKPAAARVAPKPLPTPEAPAEEAPAEAGEASEASESAS